MKNNPQTQPQDAMREAYKKGVDFFEEGVLLEISFVGHCVIIQYLLNKMKHWVIAADQKTVQVG